MRISYKKESKIKSKLIAWYDRNKRDLPWRKLNKNKKHNPFYIFVSEFMLQQTTVNTVSSKFNIFIKKWPNINKLSSINENQILKFWSGLGYYRRAKNLLKSVKIISKNFNNKIPEKYNELITLPGVGDYTAKAILGIAYNLPYMPIDTNVKRLLCRIYGLRKPINEIEYDINSLAQLYKSKNKSSKLIQSFMDYGSIICLPRNPKCSECIIANLCIANKKKITSLIPNKKKANFFKTIKYTRAYIVLNNLNEILFRKRSEVGMLPSMLEIPNDSWVRVKKHLVMDPSVRFLRKKFIKSSTIIYSFSHFDLQIEIFFTKLRKKKIDSHKWIALKDIAAFEVPTVMKKIIKSIEFN
tara:strand:- start:444 stop:1508 length:1065 start_codon:yes stop_codon:yes gene_type:complete